MLYIVIDCSKISITLFTVTYLVFADFQMVDRTVQNAFAWTVL